MSKLKVLNLYAGIGGNRKLWPNDKIEVTAVEIEPKIAEIYQRFFPNDKVIITDAHQYLLDHFEEFNFIWSSPPCPTHSRMNHFQYANKKHKFKLKYPDMRLYQEIILLRSWFKGLWCVENVISYYVPLIDAEVSNNHYFWANFKIPIMKHETRGIKDEFTNEDRVKLQCKGFEDVLDMNLSKRFKRIILNNCVKPELGLAIFNAAFKDKQKKLIEIK